MNKLTTGQTLDKILKYCLESSDDFKYLSDIQKDLFPESDEKEINNLLEKLENIAIIEIDSYASKIQVNKSTVKTFLDQGGFTKIEKQEKLDHQKMEYKENLEEKLALSNIRANDLNEKNSIYNIIGLAANIVFGVINICLLVWQILSSE